MRKNQDKGCFMTIILLPFTVMKYALLFVFGVIAGIFKIVKSFFSNSDMTGHEYEHFVADYLSFRGYRHVKVTKGSGDYGVDVIATKSGIKYAVQCKFYSNPVGIHAVQEAAAGKAYYDCDASMVVTNNTFTKVAKELAEANGVVLLENVIPTKRSKFFSGAVVLFLYVIFLSTVSAIMTEQHGALTTQDKALLGFGFAIPIIVAIWKVLKKFSVINKLKKYIKVQKQKKTGNLDIQDFKEHISECNNSDEKDDKMAIENSNTQESVFAENVLQTEKETPISLFNESSNNRDCETAIDEKNTVAFDNAYDPLFEQAAKIVIEKKSALASLLMRKFGIGYVRAATIIDQLEEYGVVSKYEENKPRQVLMTEQMWLERIAREKD